MIIIAITMWIDDLRLAVTPTRGPCACPSLAMPACNVYTIAVVTIIIVIIIIIIIIIINYYHYYHCYYVC